MGIDTWESRTRDLEEKKKGLSFSVIKSCWSLVLFKIVSHGTVSSVECWVKFS